MKDNLTKVYAAFRSGCLGKNILEAYFPFFANIICEEALDIIDEHYIGQRFNEKYEIPVPLTFVRQVLSVGVQNNSINYDRGKYVANKNLIGQYKFESIDFDRKWESIKIGFIEYCKLNDLGIQNFDIDDRMIKFIEKYDLSLVSNESYRPPDSIDVFDFAWSKYLSEIEKSHISDFDFFAALSFSNIYKEAVFYSGDDRKSFSGLNVYFDSPMIFALLGMDSPARMSSCKFLLKKMISSGCNVQIFDHCLQEIDGILSRAAGWAVSTQYDIRKANNAVRYFHDNQMDSNEIAEYCATLEDKLAQFNITVKKTNYDIYSDLFQEDESQLYSMIESKYKQQLQAISEERRQSILVDVRSIVMIYRERKGQTATRIQSSREILLTLNSTIANVSKEYESNRSINAGHIPACVSADLFGTVLWLFSPASLIEYQRKQLLADCYLALRPSKKLMNKYIESLELARASGEIEEKQFLFMRSHAVVNDALMNVTKGDYARFNERTYIEVYDEIQEIAEKRYVEEAESHKETKTQLQELINKKAEDDSTILKMSEDIQKLKKLNEDREKKDFDKKLNRWGWFSSVCLFGLPYIILIGLIEVVKSKFTEFNFYTIIRISGLIVLSILLLLLFNRGKKFCFSLVEKHLLKQQMKSSSVATIEQE